MSGGGHQNSAPAGNTTVVVGGAPAAPIAGTTSAVAVDQAAIQAQADERARLDYERQEGGGLFGILCVLILALAGAFWWFVWRKA